MLSTEKIIIASAMILVALIGYGLGFTAGKGESKREITITESELPPFFLDLEKQKAGEGGAIVPQAGSQQNSAGTFVASKKGKYYYPSDCPSAKQLSLVNIIQFGTFEEAESAGYKLGTRC